MQLIKMVRLRDKGHRTHGTRRQNWKKSFTSIDILQEDAGKDFGNFVAEKNIFGVFQITLFTFQD